jgi:hypothetical protein
MSFDPFRSFPTAEPPQDEEQIVGGLERALAQARTKIPDHDSSLTLGFPSRHEAVKALSPELPGPVPFDSRAVMDVLRGAIDRYTNGDGHKQGAWVEELAQAKDKADFAVDDSRHLAAGYAPDRRRLAAVVIILFLLAGGIGYTQFGLGGSSENVKTDTPITVHGKAVTTSIPSTTISTTTLPATTDTTEPAPVGTVAPTSTTVRRTTTTAPATTDTTAPATTDTTEPTTDTTTPTTTATTPTTTATTSSTVTTPTP